MTSSVPPGHRVNRRAALGVLALVGLGGAGVVEAFRAAGDPAPAPRVAPGTTRLVESYGPYDGEWWVPAGAAGRLPTVVLLHGGWWAPSYDRHLMDALAADLSGRGSLVWNVDYAAADTPWPQTMTTAAQAYDHLTTGRYAALVDPRRTAVVGHSAGGQLALWLAARSRPLAGAPAYAVRPSLVVAQAPVAALVQADRQGLGGGAVAELLDGSADREPGRYRESDPVALVPTGVRTACLHSRSDQLVPIGQSEAYVAAATARGDRAGLVVVPGDHFAHLDPRSEAVARLRAQLAAAP